MVVAGDFNKLSRKQEKALLLLLDSKKVEDVAREVGCGVTTIFRWLNDPVFASRFREARMEVYRHGVARLQKASSTAAEILEAIASDASMPGTARVSAARAILEHARVGIEVEDFDARLRVLEERDAGTQKVRAV